MSAPTFRPIPQGMLRAAAAAIANERAGRRGAPAVINVLDLLATVSPKLLNEVLDDARAALEASRVLELLEAAKAVTAHPFFDTCAEAIAARDRVLVAIANAEALP